MATSQLQKTIKTLADSTSLDFKIQALTSLRRIYLENQKIIKTVKDEEFCELCNLLINTSITENDKLHIETCRTLDMILPETQNRNFDCFQSILQINRKKRLKILVSLSILKDETVAAIAIANKLSILEFLNNCMQSIQPKSMNWLSQENAENAALLKNIENKTLSENDEFEEKIVNRVLQLLCRLCSLSSVGLSIRQFDTFIMDKIILLAYMGHQRQRTQALIVLQQAVKNDLGVRVRSIHKEIWEKYKMTLQNVYCKRMTLLVNLSNQDWAIQWEASISLIGTDLHRGSGLVNSLLKVEELAFKSADPNRRQAFLSWKLLIDNFALDQRELATTRRLKLLCVPLNAKNSKTELMVLTKLEVWWHLIYKVYPSIAECIDTILIPFLNICFGPFGEKPFFLQKTDHNVALGKKFTKTQIFAIHAFFQLTVNQENYSKILTFTPLFLEKLTGSVNNSVFESVYKIFIHCFGEILVLLALLSDEEVTNKLEISKVLWSSLISRIEGYDKMKTPMYKEIMIVINELIRKHLHKIPFIRDFLLSIVIKNIDNYKHMHFTESTLVDLIQTFLQVGNFSSFTSDNCQSIELLLWYLVKPKNSDYYPQTMELIQTILKILDEASKINCNNFAVCKLWCIIAKLTAKYIEDSQNINEGTAIAHNFKTVESIIAFPFTNICTDDHVDLRTMGESWRDLYKQFDFQAGLIVSVKSNEILNKISNMTMIFVKKDKRCCDFATICIDGLLGSVNYDNLPSDQEIPVFVQLLKYLVFQCFRNKSFVTEKILKALSAFLLRVFSHSIEKTASYLKIIEPAIKYMLAKIDDHSVEREISSTWSTIVELIKKLQKNLIYEVLNCYRQTIILAMLHLNRDVSSMAFSILDLKDSIDEKSKKVLEDVMNELKETSVKNNFDIAEIKEKSKKLKSMQVKPVGSFLNRKIMSPNTMSMKQSGKENMEKLKVINIEPDSQDFVEINTDITLDVNRLTEHQKEMLKKRRDDIPAMYNELSMSNSQDTQELQHWFNEKSRKSPEKKQVSTNNNEVSKTTPSSSSHFKNIIDTFRKEQTQTPDKSYTACITTSPKSSLKKYPQDGDISTEDGLRKNSKIETPPIVAKKLDFDSQAELPEDDDKILPSIPENTKVRWKNVEDNNDNMQEKNVRMLRRSSIQSQQQISLRKSNSTEELSKRGKKRRNSETVSEAVLHIEREKRSRRGIISEELNSTDESNKSEENKVADVDEKKISRRQMNEMSRLKIDMRFEPLPSRRSTAKIVESDSVDKKVTSSKDEKPKEEKVNNASKENNQQPQNSITTRRSMKNSNAITTKNGTVEKEVIAPKKDQGNRKSSITENVDTNNKLSSRKSLAGKVEINHVSTKKCKLSENTEEEIIIEDPSTPMDYEEKEKSKSPTITNDLCTIAESSQDPDIVESSQELSSSSKIDKVECFIKIKKVEMAQASKPAEESQGNDEIIDETAPVDFAGTSVTTVLIALEPEKSVPVQPEVKKVETIPIGDTSSPKSTLFFKSKGFSLQGRAAQMLGLVTKQAFTEKLTMETSRGDSISAEEVTITPMPKKDKPQKETDCLLSPSTSGKSRREKIFSNMNNKMKNEEICVSPSMKMFCNLRNDGERISPKLDRHERDENHSSIVTDREMSQNGISSSVDDSPSKRLKKELPMLEWSSANPPSLTASPSVSILKRMQDLESDTPNRKNQFQKRVSFADPPVSKEMGYEIIFDSADSPKLEKLPSSRSPISRKQTKKQAKLRLIQIDPERPKSDNDDNVLDITEQKNLDTIAVDEPIITNCNSPISSLPKIKLATVLSDISIDESQMPDKEPLEVDILINCDSDITEIKTSTQTTEHSNSFIKLDSINLSNILQKSDNNQSTLEDTVDVENISSSLDSTHNLSDKPARNCSMQSGEPGDTLPVTDSVFSNLPLSQESQSSVVQLIEPDQLDITLPIYPSLTTCSDAVEAISADLVDPLFTDELIKHLSTKSIHTVGDLAQLTERDVNRLPIKSPKIACVRKALSRYEEKVTSRTPDRRTVNVVSSSTPLGNKRRDKNRVVGDSFEDLMKSSSNNSDLVSINVSAVLDCKRPLKKHSIDTAIQTSPMKKFKLNDEETCSDMMDQCDNTFLFEAFLKRFDPERILHGYKQKMAGQSKTDLKKETLKVLGLSMEDDSEHSFKASVMKIGLHKVLEQLPKIFNSDEEFFNSVLQTYNKKFQVSTFLNFLTPSEIQENIKDKLSPTELLSILAKSLMEKNGESVHEPLSSTGDIRVLLDRVSSDSIIDLIKRRNDLMSSETLLNIILEKSTGKLSEETKKAMFKTLTETLDVCELADMYNVVIKAKVSEMKEKLCHYNL